MRTTITMFFWILILVFFSFVEHDPGLTGKLFFYITMGLSLAEDIKQIFT
jgi:hypothetical protein